MIVECKAPEMPLEQAAFDQVNSYNWALGVPYLIITNGLRHYCLESRGGAFQYMRSFPPYDLLDSQS